MQIANPDVKRPRVFRQLRYLLPLPFLVLFFFYPLAPSMCIS